MLEHQNVSFDNDGERILNNISVNIEQGDFISIVGSSGSGKSTFLKLNSHLISATNGDIYFKGKLFTEYCPTELRKSIVYCFQTPYLFGDSVIENINFPFSMAVIQLVTVGYVLEYIFGYKNPIFTTLLLFFMNFNASYNAAKRGKAIRRGLIISFLSIGTGTLVTLTILILSKIIQYESYQIIPVRGMIISNSMVALGLCYKGCL